MPIQRRLPKFGFKNINRVTYKAINLSTLQELAEAKNLNKIGLKELRSAGNTPIATSIATKKEMMRTPV